MKRQTQWAAIAMSVALVAVLTAAPFFAQQIQSSKDEVALRAAMERETVRGDLKGAIEEYKKLAQSKDRALAARALVRMAESYQKLGDAEAQKVYQRIVREYPDQKDALALAQARLGGAAQIMKTKSDREVWIGGAIVALGQVSPDGRFITSRDPNRGNLMIHDIAANVDRALTPPESMGNWTQFAHNSRISRDGKQILYVWFDENSGSSLRMLTLQENGFPEPRQLFTATDYGFIGSVDLSPDRKWVAAVIPVKEGGYEIALIAVADGAHRVLKSMKGAPDNIFFSPDGRYIAYDLPASNTSPQRDIYVLAIDGANGDNPVVVNSAMEAVMGWSPDGTLLLFSSNRTASWDLWGLPFADGKAPRAPELLKSNIGPSISLGLTSSGALYLHKRISSRDIAIAPIDLDAGRLLGPAVSFTEGFVDGAKNPGWSPDGNYLSYYACGNGSEVLGCLTIRNSHTGEVRRLPRTMTSSTGNSWSPDGRSLLVRGTDLTGRQGIFQIDAKTGEPTVVLLSDGLAGRPKWSPDGKKIFFGRGGVGTVERDLSSGAERALTGVAPQSISPDGRYFVSARQDSSTKTVSLFFIPVAGGELREALRLSDPETIGPHSAWTPDSSAVIIEKDTISGRELWLVPFTGGRPRKLDIDTNIWMQGSDSQEEQGFSLSPDGQRLAFLMGNNAEVWALENFLPTPNRKK